MINESIRERRRGKSGTLLALLKGECKLKKKILAHINKRLMAHLNSHL